MSLEFIKSYFKTTSMKIIKSLFVLFFLLMSIFSQSQNPKKQALINESLKNDDIKTQFVVLNEKSPSYLDFKNIRLVYYNKLKSNVLDTLNSFNNKLKTANTKINEQHTEIEKLKVSIQEINGNLSNVTEEKDSIDFFGIKTTKATYNTALWSIISVLLLATLFFLFRYNSSNKLTKEAKTAFKEIEEEFDSHRKKSLEREQVLRRKLQDEINKQRNA